jgi:hypothetical protein
MLGHQRGQRVACFPYLFKISEVGRNVMVFTPLISDPDPHRYIEIVESVFYCS